MYADIPRWLSITLYSWVSYRLVQQHRQEKNYRWLKQFTIVFLVFQAVWLIYLIPYVIPRYTNRLLNAVDWYPIYLPLVAIIYWLGIKGYIISYETTLSAKKANGINSTLTDSTVHEIIARLTKSMEEEKLYLDPALNLQTLSQHTGLQQKLVSAVLNQHIHKSFNAFINEYRIEAFKQKIRLADMDNLTMAGIAAECGFNSQATFQRAFKEFTGMSPSEFRKSIM
jgi:AraC-like DNA-binding protein